MIDAVWATSISTTNPTASSGDLVHGQALAGLGMVLLHTGRTKEAEPLLTESLAIHARAHNTDSWLADEVKRTFGLCRSDLEAYGAQTRTPGTKVFPPAT